MLSYLVSCTVVQSGIRGGDFWGSRGESPSPSIGCQHSSGAACDRDHSHHSPSPFVLETLLARAPRGGIVAPPRGVDSSVFRAGGVQRGLAARVVYQAGLFEDGAFGTWTPATLRSGTRAQQGVNSLPFPFTFHVVRSTSLAFCSGIVFHPRFPALFCVSCLKFTHVCTLFPQLPFPFPSLERPLRRWEAEGHASHDCLHHD